MSNFTNFLLHFIFISVFLILIVISMMVLKPFRIHHKRPYSTMSLKISYLMYLITFVILAFLILFYADIPDEASISSDDILMTMMYIVIILSFFIPNLAIMLRRKFKKIRRFYNVFFTVVNLLFVIAIILVLFYFPFTFR